MISHAHGELFPQSVSSFIDCCPDPKPPSETLQRLIEPSQYTTINGQVWLYTSVKTTASQPTHATTSASPQQAESMDSSQMPEQTSSKQTEWVQYQSGLMTTYFSGSVDATLTHTTASDIHGAKPSPSMGGEYTKEVAYGTRATPCLMDAQKSLMKTWPLPCDMHWQRYKGYTVSYFTSPWSSLPGTHTSPTWKPCFQASIIVLSCHMPDDLKWWVKLLCSPSLSRDIPGPVPLMDLNSFSDTSSGFSIGITIGNRWHTWRLLPGWKADG